MAAKPLPINTAAAGIPVGDPKEYLRLVTDAIFKLSHDKLSGEKQLYALLYIAKETLGKSRRPGTPPPLYACISLKVMARAIGCTERLLIDILADAQKRGLIGVLDDKAARKMGFPAAPHANARWYRVLQENWAKAPKYVAKAVEVTDDAPEETDAAADVPVVMKADSPVVALGPGQRMSPAAFESQSFAVDNRASVPIIVELKLNNRNLVARIFDAEAKQTKGEATLKRTAPTELRRNGEDALADGLTALGLYADDDMLRLVRKGLKCPEEFFLELVAERAARARRNRETMSQALLPAKVADANKLWPKARPEWERRQQPPETVQRRQPDRELELAREVLAKPRSHSEAELEWARAVLAGSN